MDILKSAKGTLELPKLRYVMESWVEDKRIEAVKNADDLKDAFRKRAAVIGFRAGVVFHLLERANESEELLSEECGVRSEECGAKVSDLCCRFAQLIAQYTLDEQMRIFGEQFLEAALENERSVYGTNNEALLDSLHKEFTIKDLQKLRGASTPKDTLYKIIRRWCENELVKKKDKHSWVKT